MSEEASKDGQRICSACGQPIPSASKLAIQQDGKDLCLQCQIRAAQITKGLRH
jgi:predicted CXXCH cytochrome family protein